MKPTTHRFSVTVRSDGTYEQSPCYCDCCYLGPGRVGIPCGECECCVVHMQLRREKD